MALPTILWIDMALVTKHVVNAYKRISDTVLAVHFIITVIIKWVGVHTVKGFKEGLVPGIPVYKFPGRY